MLTRTVFQWRKQQGNVGRAGTLDTMLKEKKRKKKNAINERPFERKASCIFVISSIWLT